MDVLHVYMHAQWKVFWNPYSNTSIIILLFGHKMLSKVNMKVKALWKFTHAHTETCSFHIITYDNYEICNGFDTERDSYNVLPISREKSSI